VKVTPAHDPDDYECAKRHGLLIHNLFDLQGTFLMSGRPCGLRASHPPSCCERVTCIAA
jgi:valyl-tRNA synthetase